MIPVDQTTFGVSRGNCFSACVASLLELPIADVPFFMGDEQWWSSFNDWLRPRGFYALCVMLPAEAHPPGLNILSGKSPRGPHAVVAHGIDVIHDPHPSRAGLLTREDVIVLVPLDPARKPT